MVNVDVCTRACARANVYSFMKDVCGFGVNFYLYESSLRARARDWVGFVKRCGGRESHTDLLVK